MSKTEPPIEKSSRHAKITGDFGEALVLYRLSKYRFECACVDHTGIDLIAHNPHTQEVMGISVKTRCRLPGQAEQFVRITQEHIKKMEDACQAFHCVAYLAIVVEADEIIRCFLLSLQHFQALVSRGDTTSGWKMSPRHLKLYAADPEIKTWELHTTTGRWW